MNAKEKALANISILLVEPRGAGNIGSVARAMRNTGFGDLVLVNPCEYRNDEGFSMACNASELLLKAREFTALEDAVSSSPVVVGTTRRRGRERYPVLTMDEAVPKVMELAGGNNVSILFGREDKGLKNDEISICNILFEIPTHRDYRSLNLSQAVLLVCYELFRASGVCGDSGPVIKAAPKKKYDEMFVHMEEALSALGYGEKGKEYLLKAILRTMKRLFGRTALMQKEVNMLRGIFTQIQDRVR